MPGGGGDPSGSLASIGQQKPPRRPPRPGPGRRVCVRVLERTGWGFSRRLAWPGRRGGRAGEEGGGTPSRTRPVRVSRPNAAPRRLKAASQRATMGGRLLLLFLLLAAPPGSLEGISVNGTVGGSFLLPISVPPGKTVAHIEWDFQPETGRAFVIAEFSDGEWDRPNSTDRFQSRLENISETTLRINELLKEDSGNYTSHMRFRSAEVQKQTFLLRVSGEKELSWNWMYLLLVLVLFIILVSYILVWLKVRKKLKVKKALKCLPCLSWSTRT